MRAGELFAGYGGLCLALEPVFGARPAWVVEREPAPSRMLAAAYPGTPNYGDVTATDWSAVELVELIGGGSPCPDLSGLGRRAGMGPGTRSGLWSNMLDAIRTVRPEWVAWENVRGALSTRVTPGHPMRALGKVLLDLHAAGYDAQWRLVKASDVGAPHARARVFLLARRRDAGSFTAPNVLPFACWDDDAEAWLDLAGRQYADAFPTDGAMIAGELRRLPRFAPQFPDLPLLRTPVSSEAGGGPLSRSAAAARGQTLRLTGLLLDLWHPGELDRAPDCEHSAVPGWHEYGPAVRRWEVITGRPAPAPTLPPAGRSRRHRPNPAFGEWMQGIPEGRVTSPALGLSFREQWAGIGNGVCPLQGAAAFASMHAARDDAPQAAVDRLFEDVPLFELDLLGEAVPA